MWSPSEPLEVIRIRIDRYEAEIYAEALPELGIQRFRRLLKMIRHPENAYPEEWDRLEERLAHGLKSAEARLLQVKETRRKYYAPVSPCAKGEASAALRVRNKALEAAVKREEQLVRDWKALLKIYNNERKKSK